MIEICALASGSNGNCYYIGNQHEALLVDAGISYRVLKQRMAARGLLLSKVTAVFVSHEHSDHSRGLKALEKRLAATIYLTPKTYYALGKTLRPGNFKSFSPGETISIGLFTVFPFLKSHDAAEPCSFRIHYNGKSVGVFTDIGEPCERVISHLRQCNALFLESNYDEEMLANGSYPWFLKKRVASAVGHLSNRQALELIEQYAPPHLECIFLSHLSQQNNTPEIAAGNFNAVAAQRVVKLTDRHQAGEVYRLG